MTDSTAITPIADRLRMFFEQESWSTRDEDALLAEVEKMERPIPHPVARMDALGTTEPVDLGVYGAHVAGDVSERERIARAAYESWYGSIGNGWQNETSQKDLWYKVADAVQSALAFAREAAPPVAGDVGDIVVTDQMRRAGGLAINPDEDVLAVTGHEAKLAYLAMLPLATTRPSTASEGLRKAAQVVVDQAADHYTARNGRRMSIEGDDGEKCWIIPFDPLEELRAALDHTSRKDG